MNRKILEFYDIILQIDVAGPSNAVFIDTSGLYDYPFIWKLICDKLFDVAKTSNPFNNNTSHQARVDHKSILCFYDFLYNIIYFLQGTSGSMAKRLGEYFRRKLFLIILLEWSENEILVK